MAKFTITLEREVIQNERVTRVVEAASRGEARRQAAGLAALFDDDCPDDARPAGDDECGPWEIVVVEDGGEDETDTEARVAAGHLYRAPRIDD